MLSRLRRYPLIRHVAAATEGHRLAIALAGAIIVATTTVAVAVNMYYAGGFARYDLSRPGYERERGEITRPQAFKTYDVTSPIGAGAIDEFLAEFNQHRANLRDYGDFKDRSLSDKSLQIGD